MPIIPIPGNIVPGGIIQATDETTIYNAVNGTLDYQNIANGGIRGSNIAAATVAIGNIKTAQVSTGVQQAATKHFGGIYLVMPSGAYSFWPGISTDAVAGTLASLGGGVVNDTDTDFSLTGGTNTGSFKGSIAKNTTNTAQAIVWLSVLNASNTGTNQAFLTQNYISASPPYDLGDGEIPLFVFVGLDGVAGIVAMSYVAPDPPWAKQIKPKLRLPHTFEEASKDPQKMQAIADALDSHLQTDKRIQMLQTQEASPSSAENLKTIRQQIADLGSSMKVNREVTQAEKNEDMAKIPHPFCIGNDLTGISVTMLDPHCKTTEALALLHESGEDVAKILHDGYITIDNQGLQKKAPAGVAVVGHRFKNTR